MRWTHVLVAGLALMWATPTLAQQPPQQCRPNTQGVTDWGACLRASPDNAPWRPLVLINLGTEAVLRQDYGAAVAYYDQAIPPGQEVMSDASFHAYRAVAYWRVARNAEAMRDARLVYRMLHRDPTLPATPLQYLPPHAQPEVLYAFILPILKDQHAEEFQPALTEFMAIPATDWISYANRAAVLQQIGDNEAALTMSMRALELAPGEPAVLNTHCYVLFSLGRAQEGLPHCEAAVARAPQVAAARHSLAEVFAALGRCAESERELANARRLDPASVDYQRPIACTAN